MCFWRGCSGGHAFLFSENMESREITAVFIGTHDCYFIRKELIEHAIVCAINMGIKVFLNGGQGHFDVTCASVLHQMKNRYPSIILLSRTTIFVSLTKAFSTRSSIRLRNSKTPTSSTRERSPKETSIWLKNPASQSAMFIAPAAQAGRLIMRRKTI